jgi:predicted membrane protein
MGLGAILGSLIAGISYSSDKFLSSILELGIGLTFFKLILGFVLVALFFSIIFYFIVYAISDRYQKKKLEKAIKNTYTISLD